MAKKMRITFLLMVLIIVAGNGLVAKKGDSDWSVPHTLIVYPINGDNSEKTADYIASLSPDAFIPIAEFIDLESREYGIISEPLSVSLAAGIQSLPPVAPFGGNRFQIMLWSLKMRWWAWRHDKNNDTGGVRMFVLYFDPAESRQLQHSLGLRKGRLGVVRAWASRLYTSRNNVIITHEYLHTLGATDKYDPETGMPFYPDGYADPDRVIRYPQENVEIMGGLVPVSEAEGHMPEGLWQTVIGPETAKEIGWSGEG